MLFLAAGAGVACGESCRRGGSHPRDLEVRASDVVSERDGDATAGVGTRQSGAWPARRHNPPGIMSSERREWALRMPPRAANRAARPIPRRARRIMLHYAMRRRERLAGQAPRSEEDGRAACERRCAPLIGMQAAGPAGVRGGEWAREVGGEQGGAGQASGHVRVAGESAKRRPAPGRAECQADFVAMGAWGAWREHGLWGGSALRREPTRAKCGARPGWGILFSSSVDGCRVQ